MNAVIDYYRLYAGFRAASIDHTYMTPHISRIRISRTGAVSKQLLAMGLKTSWKFLIEVGSRLKLAWLHLQLAIFA